MTFAALPILAPLAAALLILAIRRGAAALALAGAAVVAVVALLVLAYAAGYLEGEEGQPRFYAAMSCFIAAMQGLVLAGDWVLLLACWELIGFTSYLLIGFWFARPGVGAAASRAFLTTRAADLGLYLGGIVLIARTGTTEIAATLGAGGATATLAGLLLLLAAMGKSAQAPLHGWLLDAMAGPTPVSALLHSATLVAAGAILLIRASPLLPGDALLVIGLVGGATAILAGLVGLAQPDLKRTLAASTSSQYGLMLLALGAGSPVAAAAHLVAHAAMKSALFLGAGVFQHARASTAYAALAGVGRAHRRAFAGFAVAGLALAGVPPLAGFWSKDAILAATLHSPQRVALVPLGVLGTALTGAYVARAFRLLWRGEGDDEPAGGQAWMGAGLAGLAALAATLGVAVRPLGRVLGAEVPEDPLGVALGLVAVLGGLALGWWVPAERLLGPLRAAAAAGFRVDGGLAGLVAGPALALAHATDRLDRRIHGVVLAVGRGALAGAGAADDLDGGVHATVAGVGRANLALAGASRRTDERGIDGAIGALVRGTRALGGRVRRLQTGLVHREMALATAGGALLLAILFATALLGR